MLLAECEVAVGRELNRSSATLCSGLALPLATGADATGVSVKYTNVDVLLMLLFFWYYILIKNVEGYLVLKDHLLTETASLDYSCSAEAPPSSVTHKHTYFPL